MGYVRIITRNKFIDRLKLRMRRRERELLPWDEETARAVAERAGAVAPAFDPPSSLWREVERLPEAERELLVGVYRLEGKTLSGDVGRDRRSARHPETTAAPGALIVLRGRGLAGESRVGG